MQPLGIDNVFLPVADVAAAVEWYERVAGLHAKFGTEDMAVMAVGEDVAGVILSRSDAPGGTAVWFEVRDAEAAAHEVGGETFHVATGRCVQIDDPWGNHVGFTDYSKRPELGRLAPAE